MRFLLDTHVWLWLTSEPERLQIPTLEQLSRSDCELYLSVASTWEIGVKFAMGKLQLPDPPAIYVASRLSRDRVTNLPIEMAHALRAAALPPIHKDPFDRLLVAQAQILGLRLVTHDTWVQRYEVDWLAA